VSPPTSCSELRRSFPIYATFCNHTRYMTGSIRCRKQLGLWPIVRIIAADRTPIRKILLHKRLRRLDSLYFPHVHVTPHLNSNLSKSCQRQCSYLSARAKSQSLQSKPLTRWLDRYQSAGNRRSGRGGTLLHAEEAIDLSLGPRKQDTGLQASTSESLSLNAIGT
jgi:hypothetical protein